MLSADHFVVTAEIPAQIANGYSVLETVEQSSLLIVLQIETFVYACWAQLHAQAL